MVAIAKNLETRIIPVKYPIDIEESPAKKHNISSGNKGNKNIVVKKRLSFPFNFLCHFFNESSPTIHETALFPNFLPIKNAVNEPSKMPIKLKTTVLKAPNNATPASVLTRLGIGKTTTCKY